MGTGGDAGNVGTGGSGGTSMPGDASQDGNPTDASTTDGGSTIGPQGGEVLGPGGAKLTIPPGALTADTEVRIVLATDSPPLRADAKVVGRTLAFLPHGLTFAVPATVHFPFDTAAAGQDVPKLFWAEQGKPWTVLTDATISAGALKAQITHLSWGEPVVPVWQPAVETRGGYTCALGASGSVWCWGWGPEVGPGGLERPTLRHEQPARCLVLGRSEQRRARHRSGRQHAASDAREDPAELERRSADSEPLAAGDGVDERLQVAR
jgi:hypothetical protein